MQCLCPNGVNPALRAESAVYLEASRFAPWSGSRLTCFSVQLLPLSHGISTISHGFLADESEPLRIGWKEYLDLPEMGIFRLKAKIDTGARTSALHVDALKMVETLPDGTEIAEMEIGSTAAIPSAGSRRGCRCSAGCG